MDEIGIPLDEIFGVDPEDQVAPDQGWPQTPVDGAPPETWVPQSVDASLLQVAPDQGWPQTPVDGASPETWVPQSVDGSSVRLPAPSPPVPAPSALPVDFPASPSAGGFPPVDLPPQVHTPLGDLAYFNRPPPGVDYAASRSAGVSAPVDSAPSTGPTAPVDHAASPSLLFRDLKPPRKARKARVGPVPLPDSGRRRNKVKHHWIRITWLRRTLKTTAVALAMVALAIGSLIGYAYYRYGQVKKVAIPALVQVNPQINPGENILLVGSDTLAPLTPGVTATVPAGGGSGAAPAPHANVIMLFHLDLTAGQASVLSVPPLLEVTPQGEAAPETLDTIFSQGPAALVNAIVQVFGIPVNHYAGIDDAGVVALVKDLGGLHLRFPYPVQDTYSGLNVARTGCDLLNGAQVLELMRSNDYQYETGFSWTSDTTGSYGVADRQRTVLGAIGSKAVSAGITNPLTGNGFVGSLVNDVTLDSTFSLLDVFSLADKLGSGNLTHAETYTFSTYVVNGPNQTLLLEYDPSLAQQVVNAFLGEPTPGSGFAPVGTQAGAPASTVTSAPGQQAPPTDFDPKAC